MNLDKFVSETLLEISQGIRDANAQLNANKEKHDSPNVFFLKPGGRQELGTGLEFDVAVTTRTEGKGQAGAKIKLAVVEAELGGGSGATKEQVSRIKFTVYVGQWVG
jgi:hypothetical protein